MKTLKSKFIILFSFIIIVNLIGFSVVFRTIAGQGADAVILNLAGKQRMLTQKMSKEAFAVSQGIMEAGALLKTKGLFDKTLKGLISGDSSLGLPLAKDKAFINQLQVVTALWEPFKNEITFVAEHSDKINNAVHFINKNNLTLLKEMNVAVGLMAEAGLPTNVINLAGRQRMLAQKMAKEAVELKQNLIKKNILEKTIVTFDTTLTGLINGDNVLSIALIDDPAIQSQLGKVNKIWEGFKTNLNNLIGESDKITSALNYIKGKNIELLKNMNKGVKIYENVASQKVQTLKTVQVIILIAFFLIIILAWIFFASPLIKTLTDIASEVMGGADQVNAAAGQISSSSQNMASGATEQASSIEETSSALEELSSQTTNNAKTASEANQLSSNASSSASKGNTTIEAMIASMSAMNESSKKISNIIKVIDEIAFQTNLLALNAAVEAARAGEHGKGFAVVAEEVRNLAQRSANAAKDTAALIEDSIHKTEDGATMANESGEVLKEIVTNSQKVTNLIGEITSSSREQADGVEQINKAVAEMDKITQSNAANAEQTAAASEEMSAQAQSLLELVARLNSVITGSNGSNGSGARTSAPPVQTVPQPQAVQRQAPPLRQVQAKRPAMVTPKDVIPMDDDDDFKDF